MCFDDHVDKSISNYTFLLTKLTVKATLSTILSTMFRLHRVFFSTLVWSFQISKNSFSKYLKTFCLPSFRRPNSVKFSLLLSCSEHVMNPVFSFSFSLFFFWKKVKPTGKDHILLTTIHNYDCKEWQQHTTKKTIR